MMDKIIAYLTSSKFQESILSLHITGQEKVPVKIPEIFITVNELLLFLRRERGIVITGKDVNKLKQDFVLDKIEGWDLNGKFGEDIKKLEPILYPTVFNPNGFLIFDRIMENQKINGRGVQADIIFFYHKLKEKGFIHAKVENFKLWFIKQYPNFPIIDRYHSLERIYPSNSRKQRLLEALDPFTSK
jgi:hypothetical protein